MFHVLHVRVIATIWCMVMILNYCMCSAGSGSPHEVTQAGRGGLGTRLASRGSTKAVNNDDVL